MRDDDPVPEKLCESRRETIAEQINGLRKAIYLSGFAMTTIIVIVQFILSFK